MPSINAPRATPVQPALVPTSKAVTPGASPSPPVAGQLGSQTIAAQAPGPLPQVAAARPPPGSVASRLALSERALTLADPDQPLAGPSQRQRQCMLREPFRAAGFNDQAIRLMESAKMTLEEAQAYQASGTEINPHTLPKGRVARGAVLGEGALNTAFQADLALGGQAPSSGVIKVLNKADPHPAGGVSGIDPKDANTAARNLGALALAKLLEFDVIVDTKVVLAGVGEGPKTPHLFMANAGDYDADHSGAAVFDNPAVRREATKLQLVDCLIGAIDRTPANYFITVRANGSAQVTGIDNDQCFGQWLTDPNQIKGSKDKLPGSMDDKGKPNNRESFRSSPMPKVIDYPMQNKLGELADTPDLVSSALRELGLKEPEVDATLQRLATMRDIVNDPSQTKVIPVSGWHLPNNLTRVNPQNSLFAAGKHWVTGGRETALFQSKIEAALADKDFGGPAADQAAEGYKSLTGDQQQSQCLLQVRLALASGAMALVDHHFVSWLEKAAVPASQVQAYRASQVDAFDRAARDEDGLKVFLDLLTKAKDDTGPLLKEARLAPAAMPQPPAQSAP